MNKEPFCVMRACRALMNKVRAILTKMYSPAVEVGDKRNVRKKDEIDADDKRGAELNKTWRKMLREDPWRKKIMTHVRLLTSAMGLFFLMFWLDGIYFSSKNSISGFICGGVAATIPYWLWAGKWHHKIEKNVFEAFKKKFGKHFHLK